MKLKAFFTVIVVMILAIVYRIRLFLEMNGIFNSGMMVPQQYQQWQSQVETVAGTVISITASTPSTFDGAGYAGSGMNFVPIGEVTDAGEHGREYALVTHNPVAQRGTQKFKGSFNEGSMTVQLAVDNDDAGQVIAQAALNSDNNYSFKVAYQGGDIDYFQAKVMSYKKAVGTVDTIRSATMQLEITTNSTGVGIVSVNV